MRPSYTQAPHIARRIHAYFGPTGEMGIPHHAFDRIRHTAADAEHADMPHADHALTHAAPAFPGAGSCLEGAQHHMRDAARPPAGV